MRIADFRLQISNRAVADTGFSVCILKSKICILHPRPVTTLVQPCKPILEPEARKAL